MRSIRLCLPLLALAACADPAVDPDSAVGDWSLARELTFVDPCPSFDFADSLDITVERRDDGALQVTAPGNAPRVLEGEDLVFSTNESWSSSDGDATPTIEWDIALESDDALAGAAETHFLFDTPEAGTTCRYEWSVEGARVTN